METRIKEMFAELAHAPSQMRPSKYWENINRENQAELSKEGYENFKRTLATSYFTWLVRLRPSLRPYDGQLPFLIEQLPRAIVLKAAVRTALSRAQPPFSWRRSISYAFITRLLWEYASAHDPEGLLLRVDEPLEGNPPRVYRRGKLISQDLANSVLERQAVLAPEVDRGAIRRILELGAGYGRTAFAFLSSMPGLKYMIADIPPALAVSERYLSHVFADRRIFRFRPFQAYEAVREELEAADIVFLLPHQLELLPAKSVDAFVNISSLHEMRIDQIRYYFVTLQRLVRKYFYLKEAKERKLAYENIVIREIDYPIPAEWRRIYWRTCAVQEDFFEALFELPEAT